jgi:hypothetical protein
MQQRGEIWLGGTSFDDAYVHGWGVLFQSPLALWGQDSGWSQN